jgi:hypothetical protein
MEAANPDDPPCSTWFDEPGEMVGGRWRPARRVGYAQGGREEGIVLWWRYLDSIQPMVVHGDKELFPPWIIFDDPTSPTMIQQLPNGRDRPESREALRDGLRRTLLRNNNSGLGPDHQVRRKGWEQVMLV